MLTLANVTVNKSKNWLLGISVKIQKAWNSKDIKELYYLIRLVSDPQFFLSTQVKGRIVFTYVGIIKRWTVLFTDLFYNPTRGKRHQTSCSSLQDLCWFDTVYRITPLTNIGKDGCPRFIYMFMQFHRDVEARDWFSAYFSFDKWVKHSTNTLGKGMNPIILLTAMGK